MTLARILTIEDDAAIRRGVVDALRFAGYEPIEAADGLMGVEMARRRDYDLLLLDLVLPGCSGLEILDAVRRDRPTLPVIILSAKGEEGDRVSGLQRGADDYVVKPFSVKELLARVEAVLRRSPQRPTDVARVELSNCVVDLGRAEALFTDGRREALTERECEALRYLAENAGRIISRKELLDHVWRIDARGTTTRTVDMLVARLRDKLGDSADAPNAIRTIRGKGYEWIAGAAASSKTAVE